MALVIENLRVELGARLVLDAVSLAVERGQLCAVIGPNGSGKSTLLRAIAGLVKPQNGEIGFDGAPLPPQRASRARVVAMLPQNPTIDGEMSVEETVLLGRTPHLPPYGAPSRRDLDAVEAALSEVAPDLHGRKVGELSGGERQRVMLGRALAMEAPVLLLDEPVSALDVRFQHEILALVRRQTRSRQLATLCVLHGINLAASIADSMLLLNENGRVVAAGSPAEVMTEAHLSAVYATPLRVTPHPLSGRPQAQSWWPFETDSSRREA